MDHYINALQKYADFSGRARRKEYWQFILFYIIFALAFAALDFALGLPGMLLNIYCLAMIIPTLSCAARRLHDTGRSGWWQLLSLIPLIGGLVLLVFLVLDGESENGYGENPKAMA